MPENYLLVFFKINAHDYVKQAQKMGAVALLVSKKVKSSLPTLVVENTQDALSKIATWHLAISHRWAISPK
jgi:UDP-N-acetylmuramoyl-tripeptide--D-alanyl-D-alanine ligase